MDHRDLGHRQQGLEQSHNILFVHLPLLPSTYSVPGTVAPVNRRVENPCSGRETPLWEAGHNRMIKSSNSKPMVEVGAKGEMKERREEQSARDGAGWHTGYILM